MFLKYFKVSWPTACRLMSIDSEYINYCVRYSSQSVDQLEREVRLPFPRASKIQYKSEWMKRSERSGCAACRIDSEKRIYRRLKKSGRESLVSFAKLSTF